MNGRLTEQLLYMYKLIILLVTVILSTGCASLNGREPAEGDPWESYNRAMFSFNDGFYEHLLDPITRGYKAITPDFIETGVSNVFSHADDLFVMVNDLLQFKLKQFIRDFMRFIYNTFFGLFGLIDVASHMDLPKNKEDFGQTLATWGWTDSTYFVLPFLGPSTIRDSAGIGAEFYLDPVNNIEDIRTRNGVIVLRAIDTNAGLLKAKKIVSQASFDKYTFTREAYLQLRNNRIHDGNPPREKPIDMTPTKEDEALDDELELELLKTP